MASFNQRHCFHCKDPLEEHERCQRCTCKRCWSGLSKGFCHICNEYSSIDDSNPNSFIDSPKVFNPPPQPLTHSIESLNANPNFDNTPQEQSSHYQDPSENFAQNFSQCPPQINQNFCYGCGDSLDDFFCQRCTCEFCGNGAHYGYDCPPQVPFVYNQDPCFNQNYDNFPQTSPSFQQQYICCTRCGGPHETCQCDQLIFDEPYCANCGGLHETFQCQPINQNYYEPNPCYDSKQVANFSTYPSAGHLTLFAYDMNDDEEYTIAITPEKPVDSLIMEDEHLDTIPETESDEFINDDESSHEEVIHEMSFKTYSNPLFDLDEEIISSEFNPIHNEDLDSTPKDVRFDAESYLLESATRSILYDGELLYDNSTPPPEEAFQANSDTIIESLSPSPIPVEDNDSLREEIDIFSGPDDSIPPGIESDDYDSEGDDNSTSLPEFESFHVDYPDSRDSTIDV
ncbi:hypothetical protein Tco_0025179 [Tanacetum coccineum]